MVHHNQRVCGLQVWRCRFRRHRQFFAERAGFFSLTHRRAGSAWVFRCGSGLPSGVKFFMDRVESLLIDVGIDLRGGDIGMAEQFLNDAQVSATAEQVGSEAVTQEVRVQADRQSGGRGPVFDDLPRALGGQTATVNADKEMTSGFRSDETRSSLCEIVAQRRAGGPADRNDPCFITFAGDPDKSFF